MPPGMRPRRCEHGPHQEGAVFGHVHQWPGALVAPHRQAVDVDSGHRPGRGLAFPPQPKDIDLPAGGDQCLGLAADSRVFFVVGMDDHADWAFGHE